MSTFSEQERLANDLLQRKGIFVVYKATRAGASISLVKVALQKGLKVVVLTPTKRILKAIQDIVPPLLGYSPRMAIVGPNSELCTKLDPKLGRKLAFQFKENCTKCVHNGKPSECKYQALRMNDFDLYCLTYDKLQALIQHQTKDTTMIIDKLLAADVLILDEFTTAMLGDIQTTELVYNYNGLLKQLSEDIIALLRDNSPFAIPKPRVTHTLFGGGMIDEGIMIAKLWTEGIEVENTKHIPILARIINHTKQKKLISASQVIIGQTELVKEVALKYRNVLEQHGIHILHKTGGVSFESQ